MAANLPWVKAMPKPVFFGSAAGPVCSHLPEPGPSRMKTSTEAGSKGSPPAGQDRSGEPAMVGARDQLDQRFVYTVVSPRARGLSVGVNLSPDGHCNFDCAYCEVKRSGPGHGVRLDVAELLTELERTLELVQSGRLRECARYRNMPGELLQLRHVALSGEGEPTLSPQFGEVVEAIIHLRTCGRLPWFKLVLITNASRLDEPAVAGVLRQFTSRDEIWAKLEAGTEDYAGRVNRPDRPLDRIVDNILQLARERPVVVQSLFPTINGEEPPEAEVEAYLQRLLELKQGGALIPLVQIYSATRPSAHSECGHLSLRALSQIARRVREVTGLVAEVF